MFGTIFGVNILVFILFDIIFTAAIIIFIVSVIKNIHKTHKDIDTDLNGYSSQIDIGGVKFTFGKQNNSESEIPKQTKVCRYCGAKQTEDKTTCDNCGAVL